MRAASRATPRRNRVDEPCELHPQALLLGHLHGDVDGRVVGRLEEQHLRRRACREDRLDRLRKGGGALRQPRLQSRCDGAEMPKGRVRDGPRERGVASRQARGREIVVEHLVQLQPADERA